MKIGEDYLAYHELAIDHDDSIVVAEALKHKDMIMQNPVQGRKQLLDELTQHWESEPDNPMVFSEERGVRDPRLGIAADSLKLFVFNIYQKKVLPQEMTFDPMTELDMAEELYAKFFLANRANMQQLPHAS